MSNGYISAFGSNGGGGGVGTQGTQGIQGTQGVQGVGSIGYYAQAQQSLTQDAPFVGSNIPMPFNVSNANGFS